jgi:hypothetical protein
MPPRTRRRVLVDPADMVCDKVVTDQIAAYAPVRANGHRQARLYAHTLREIASVPTITSHQRRDVRSVCCVLVARCGEGTGPVDDSYAIRTRRLLGWHRAAASRRAAPHGHGPNPCRPAAADCPRGSPDAERQRADGLAPGRRWHPSRRAHPRVGADQRSATSQPAPPAGIDGRCGEPQDRSAVDRVMDPTNDYSISYYTASVYYASWLV